MLMWRVKILVDASVLVQFYLVEVCTARGPFRSELLIVLRCVLSLSELFFFFLDFIKFPTLRRGWLPGNRRRIAEKKMSSWIEKCAVLVC